MLKRNIPLGKPLITLAKGNVGYVGNVFPPSHTRACAHARTIGMAKENIPNIPNIPKVSKNQMVTKGNVRGNVQTHLPNIPQSPIG
jgi:hypothetical protein